MKKIFIFSFIIFIFVFFISCITTFVVYSNYDFTSSSTKYYSSSEEYTWPLPNYTTISSYFGPRISPTSGASSYHSGIDIPAPEGTEIFSASSGIVIYQAFNGSNGYTLKIQNGSTIFSYSHISPNFIISVGDFIEKGKRIAYVGPKYIYNLPHNPYSDSSGKQTNGATTGTHLHFSISINNELIDPLTIFPKINNY